VLLATQRFWDPFFSVDQLHFLAVLSTPGCVQVGVLFGNPETTSGGNALKFYASMRLDIRARDKITETGRVEPVGNSVKVKVVKNKVRLLHWRWSCASICFEACHGLWLQWQVCVHHLWCGRKSRVQPECGWCWAGKSRLCKLPFCDLFV
jgi:hypothetical protein